MGKRMCVFVMLPDMQDIASHEWRGGQRRRKLVNLKGREMGKGPISGSASNDKDTHHEDCKLVSIRNPPNSSFYAARHQRCA